MFKEFVTEKQIEEVKKKRQEEWEKVRRPDQPLVKEEEEYDHRSLYERLKSQKDKAEADKAEQFKFKNMIYKGLDDDESKFLHLVSKQRAEQKAQRLQQEKEEILFFKEAVERAADEAPSVPASSPPANPRVVPAKPPTSILKSGLVRIKRKSESNDSSSNTSDGVTANKKQRTQENHDDNDRVALTTGESVAITTSKDSPLHTLCVYSDSSSDDNE